jgi:hypothetical protein
MKKLIVLLLALGVVSAFVAGCSGGAEEDAGTAGTATAGTAGAEEGAGE